MLKCCGSMTQSAMQVTLVVCKIPEFKTQNAIKHIEMKLHKDCRSLKKMLVIKLYLALVSLNYFLGIKPAPHF